MKKLVSLLLAVALMLGLAANVGADWHNFRNSAENMAITTAPVPTDPAKTEEKWSTAQSLKEGSGWNINNPAPMLLVEGKLLTTSGSNLVELDAATGEILRTAEMADVNGTLGNSAPAYGDGTIFMPLQDGRVQAFDAETLEAVWISENLGSQCTTGLVYKDGFVYGCTGNASPGKVFCLTAEDETPETCQEKAALWAVYNEEDDKGSYWSTPYVSDTAVVYGTDSGFLCSRSRTDGQLISRLQLPEGKQRSGIAYAGGKVYGGTSAGYLFSAVLAEDGSLSQLKAEKDDTVSSITSTPVVYNGVVYYGGSKMVVAADAETLLTLRTTGDTGFEQPSFGGAVQCSLLLHPGQDGVYLYATQNCTPGGLYLVKDDGETMTAAVLHTPAEEKQDYCLVSPVCDENGTIYYRNDSGYLFAVGTKEEPPVVTSVTASVSVVDHRGNELYPQTEKVMPQGSTAYDILMQTGLNVDAVSTEYGMYVRAIEGLAEKTTDGLCYWMYEVNGESPMVGASSYVLQTGDRVCWKYYAEEPVPPVLTSVTASVSVVDHRGNELYPQTEKVMPQGSTAYDILMQTGLDVDAVSTEYGMYVRAIEGLAEKSAGEASGWLYEVNGESPMVGASSYILQAGDQVCWKFFAAEQPPVIMPSAPSRPQQPEKAPLPYTDTAGHWGEEAIRFVTEQGMMNGVSAETFSPDAFLTRGMLATILYRLAGSPETEPAACADVPADSWYAGGIFWAAKTEVLLGAGDGRFLPEAEITRQELAVMLWRYAGRQTGNGDLSVFSDGEQAAAWAEAALNWAVEAGILTGRTGGLLDPAGKATRAETAAMLMRFVEAESGK